jgi:hypothetical protein
MAAKCGTIALLFLVPVLYFSVHETKNHDVVKAKLEECAGLRGFFGWAPLWEEGK